MRRVLRQPREPFLLFQSSFSPLNSYRVITGRGQSPFYLSKLQCFPPSPPLSLRLSFGLVSLRRTDCSPYLFQIDIINTGKKGWGEVFRFGFCS